LAYPWRPVANTELQLPVGSRSRGPGIERRPVACVRGPRRPGEGHVQAEARAASQTLPL